MGRENLWEIYNAGQIQNVCEKKGFSVFLSYKESRKKARIIFCYERRSVIMDKKISEIAKELRNLKHRRKILKAVLDALDAKIEQAKALGAK